MSKSYFRHLRLITGRNELTNRTIPSVTGGVTLLVEESGSGTVDITFALTNDTENYCRNTGRSVCMSRHNSPKASRYKVKNVIVDEDQDAAKALLVHLRSNDIDMTTREGRLLSILEDKLWDIEDSEYAYSMPEL